MESEEKKNQAYLVGIGVMTGLIPNSFSKNSESTLEAAAPKSTASEPRVKSNPAPAPESRAAPGRRPEPDSRRPPGKKRSPRRAG